MYRSAPLNTHDAEGHLKVLAGPTPEQLPSPLSIPSPASIHKAHLDEAVDAVLRHRVSGEPVTISVASAEEYDSVATYLWYKVRARCELYPSRSRLVKTLGCSVSTSKDWVLAVMPAPSGTHEFLANFIISEIMAAVQSPSFLAAAWPRTVDRSTGRASVSCEYRGERFEIRPDGSLTFRDYEVPWVVVEVANSESTAHIQEKMWTYMLGTLGVIRYGVCLNMFTRAKFNRDIVQPKQHSRWKAMVAVEIRRLRNAGAGGSEVTIKKQAVSNIARRLRKEPDLLCDPEDDLILQRPGKYVLVTISVFSSELTTLPDGTLQRRLSSPVPATPIWPQQSVAGFSIRWKDINHPDLREEMLLTEAFISFDRLHSMVNNEFTAPPTATWQRDSVDISVAPPSPASSSDIDIFSGDDSDDAD
ncbi:hypothetical protein FN846DRAFT_914664 [Sphaerosporella brunnea]|uniref:Uncharacterized protein n=1 Tax=Sphaerosporella brunnea TaxID=1250544 RepID=A0A5J5ECY8_9PEZI|nr:hypothetical protein FN846DRAFT_914663 [Sphaerosporella brunnea]KAA8892938.1 hypothetical protein FN846DRAFT_914664 [Sphaerosporella brunnea]